MSARVRDRLDDRTLHIENIPDQDSIYLTIYNTGVGIEFTLTAFLEAVAAELDVIMIPRTDLPKVTEDKYGDGLVVSGDDFGPYTPNLNPAELRVAALRQIAIAEHLEQHPPVDEAQVDALADVLRNMSADAWTGNSEDIARRLLATGKVQVTA